MPQQDQQSPRRPYSREEEELRPKREEKRKRSALDWRNIGLAVAGLLLAGFLVGWENIWQALSSNPQVVLGGLGAVVFSILIWRVVKHSPSATRYLTEQHQYLPVVLVLLPFSALTIWLTFTKVSLQGLSGHAAAAGAITLWTISLALYNKYPSKDIDFFKEMAGGNVAAAIGFFAVAFCLALLILGALSVIVV